MRAFLLRLPGFALFLVESAVDVAVPEPLPRLWLVLLREYTRRPPFALELCTVSLPVSPASRRVSKVAAAVVSLSYSIERVQPVSTCAAHSGDIQTRDGSILHSLFKVGLCDGLGGFGRLAALGGSGAIGRGFSKRSSHRRLRLRHFAPVSRAGPFAHRDEAYYVPALRRTIGTAVQVAGRRPTVGPLMVWWRSFTAPALEEAQRAVASSTLRTTRESGAQGCPLAAGAVAPRGRGCCGCCRCSRGCGCGCGCG
eukprot:scaffold3880_cov403-Prasinococcus_capsulatus_cf.AAC.1